MLFAGCTKGSGDAAPEKATPEISVRTAVATTQPFTETVGALGIVSPRSGHVASLGAPGPGRVASVLVAAGQRVAQGQSLIVLEQPQFQAAAQSAQAALTAAQQAYDRAKRLADQGIAPRKDVEQAAAELAKARADEGAARRAEQLSTLRAPIAGVVTRMSAALGASVDANQPLVDIADPAALDVLLNVTPTDAGRVHAGQRVTLMAGESPSGESIGSGAVVDVAATVDSATRGVSVRVSVTSSKRPLRLGETVYGLIAVATVANAVVVPAEALVPEGDGFKVFVVDDKNIAHAHEVTVGARTAQTARILSGVTAGEKVVTYGAYGVSDSAKVVQDSTERQRGAGAARARSGGATNP